MLSSCAVVGTVFSQQDIDGVYQSKNGSKITIKQDNFQLNKITGWNTIVKTSVSSGTVKLIDDNLLEFNSSYQLNKFGNGELDLKIDQYKDNESSGLKIKLLDFDKIKYEPLDIEFSVRVELNTVEVGNYTLDKLREDNFFIKIDKKIEYDTFIYIELIMFSKCIVCTTSKTNTLYEYVLFSEGNNVITMNLKKYNNIFNYLFLEKDYALFNSSTITWDGLVYIKE